MNTKTSLVLAAMLVACGGDDDTTVWEDGGAIDAPVEYDAGPDAAKVDAGDAGILPPESVEVSWTIQRQGGEAGCGTDVVQVAIAAGGKQLLAPCADGKLTVAPAGIARLELQVLGANFRVLGGAHHTLGGSATAQVTVTLTDEPLPQLEALSAGITALVMMDPELLDVGPMSLTPTESCCKAEGQLCEPAENTWDGFEIVKFALTDSHRYQYGASRTGNTLRLTAVADFDCDGVLVDRVVQGRINGSIVTWEAPVSVNPYD